MEVSLEPAPPGPKPPKTTEESKPMNGTLIVRCDVADATVLLDGEHVGMANKEIPGLRPGSREVRVRADYWAEAVDQVEIEAGQLAEIRPHMRKKDPSTELPDYHGQVTGPCPQCGHPTVRARRWETKNDELYFGCENFERCKWTNRYLLAGR